MTLLQEIRLMNEAMILYLKKIGKCSKRNEIISNILNDETCFFKMEKNDAYIILEDIGIAENNISTIYSKLISSDTYFYLQKVGKINDKDKDLIIKYKNYDYNNMFIT